MDWVRFLEENNIHYVTRGPNTKRGEVSIQCPMCGEDDPSEHLGINLTRGYWGCHRDQSHRGKSPHRLVKALLRCSTTQARYTVSQYSHADPDTLDAALISLEKADDLYPSESKPITEKNLRSQFHNFHKIRPRGVTKRFFRYLQSRGYENPQNLIKEYDLRCALIGRYADRIIIPIYMNEELLGWTSRAIIDPREAPRYLASSEDVKTTILNYDQLKKGGNRLFIVEGPFDAIRMDYQVNNQHPLIVRATCTFGTSVTVSQFALLRSIVPEFDEAWVLFDKGADGPAAELASWIRAKIAYLPFNKKDPGELSDLELEAACSTTFNGRFVDPWNTVVGATLRNRSQRLAATLTRNNALLKQLSNKP